MPTILLKEKDLHGDIHVRIWLMMNCIVNCKKEKERWRFGEMDDFNSMILSILCGSKRKISINTIIQLNKSVKIFSSPYELAEKFAEELVKMINESAKNKKPFTVALSGGSTPELLFSVLGEQFSKSVNHGNMCIFSGVMKDVFLLIIRKVISE